MSPFSHVFMFILGNSVDAVACNTRVTKHPSILCFFSEPSAQNLEMRHLLGVNLPTIGLCISGRCLLLPRNPEKDACDNYSSGRALRERNDAAPSTRASLIKKPCLFSITCILAAQVIVLLTTQLYCTSGIRR